MPELFNPEQIQELQTLVTAAVAAALPQGPPAVPQDQMAAAAAAAVAAVAPAVAAVEVGAISHTFPPFWPEDVDGFFTSFEAACANKKITQDGSKYSKLISVLTQEARARMTGRLPEPGTNPDDYAKLKERLKASYAKTEMERVAELMSITSLGDRTPEQLLNYMQGLLPGELKSPLFRYVWLTALPDSVHQVLSADDGDLEELAVKATRMMKEAVVKKKRLERINAISSSSSSRDDLGEIDAISSNTAKAKTGLVCANHLRFPGNCYRCFEPDRCLLRDAIVRKDGGGGAKKKSGNFKAGRQ